MLPTPSWLRLGKSRPQKQQEPQSDEQHQKEPHKSGFQRPVGKRDELSNDKQHQEQPKVNRKPTSSSSSSLFAGPKLRLNRKHRSNQNLTTHEDYQSAQPKSGRRQGNHLSALIPRALANLLTRAFTSHNPRPQAHHTSSSLIASPTNSSEDANSRLNQQEGQLQFEASPASNRPTLEPSNQVHRLDQTIGLTRSAGHQLGDQPSDITERHSGIVVVAVADASAFLADVDEQTNDKLSSGQRNETSQRQWTSQADQATATGADSLAELNMEPNDDGHVDYDADGMSRHKPDADSRSLIKNQFDLGADLEFSSPAMTHPAAPITRHSHYSQPATTQASSSSELSVESASRENSTKRVASSQPTSGGQTEQTTSLTVGTDQVNRATSSDLGTSHSKSVCHLTAKTYDNQCALHPWCQCPGKIMQCEPQSSTPSLSNESEEMPPVPLQRHQPNPRLTQEPSDVRSDSTATSKINNKNGAQRKKPTSEEESKRRTSLRESKATTRQSGRSRRLALWPLARQTLDNNSIFGDCEDIHSDHLAGRLFHLPVKSSATKRTPEKVFAEALDLALAVVKQSNHNHKRPFGQPFEQPTAVWILNAIGAKLNNLKPAKSRSGQVGVNGPAAKEFRRRSYDDREGDNNISIVLQTSDAHDLEKQKASCIKSSKAWRSNNNNNIFGLASQMDMKRASVTDLKLAKCLLDQDYNQTVRLFIRKSALNWNFNCFTFDALCCGRSLTELLLHLFDYYDLYRIFNLDIVNVLKCFRLLEFGYHSTNPYHNSVHAADVTQAMHCFIQENKIRKHMTHLEILCSILAAVCHDLDHPGVNQSFLVATNNPLASLYNNSSVLENHHWRFALCIFKESKLFEHFKDDVFDEMKNQLRQLILATDIARQNEYLKRFKDLTSSRKFSMQNTDDRALVLQMALKCADLGNPCRPWLISRVWSNLICDEFYKMGRAEKRLGLPLTPICQREKTSVASIQADFFRFIVLPLLELWHKFLRSPLSDLLMSNFDHNYKRWQRANLIMQQLRRRKSLACLEPVVKPVFKTYPRPSLSS